LFFSQHFLASDQRDQFRPLKSRWGYNKLAAVLQYFLIMHVLRGGFWHFSLLIGMAPAINHPLNADWSHETI
jgi:hypothetical protein